MISRKFVVKDNKRIFKDIPSDVKVYTGFSLSVHDLYALEEALVEKFEFYSELGGVGQSSDSFVQIAVTNTFFDNATRLVEIGEIYEVVLLPTQEFYSWLGDDDNSYSSEVKSQESFVEVGEYVYFYYESKRRGKAYYRGQVVACSGFEYFTIKTPCGKFRTFNPSSLARRVIPHGVISPGLEDLLEISLERKKFGKEIHVELKVRNLDRETGKVAA